MLYTAFARTAPGCPSPPEGSWTLPPGYSRYRVVINDVVGLRASGWAWRTCGIRQHRRPITTAVDDMQPHATLRVLPHTPGCPTYCRAHCYALCLHLVYVTSVFHALPRVAGALTRAVAATILPGRNGATAALSLNHQHLRQGTDKREHGIPG